MPGQFDAALYQHIKDVTSSLWFDGLPSAQLAGRTFSSELFSDKCNLVGRDVTHQVSIDIDLGI